MRLLYDAFPYERFGSYRGTVRSVATTMLGPAEMPEPVAAEPAYRVKVALDRQTVDAFGREVTLQPDMTLRADIILVSHAQFQGDFRPYDRRRARADAIDLSRRPLQRRGAFHSQEEGASLTLRWGLL